MDNNPQKKRSRFDEPPVTNFKSNNSHLAAILGVPNDNQNSYSANSSSSNMNLMSAKQTTIITTNNSNNNKIKNTQLFVGNIPSGIEGKVIQEFLNTAMKQSGLVPLDTTEPPISNINLGLSNKFGFLECIGEKEAQAALNLNGIPFLNVYLKVSRPDKFDDSCESGMIKSKTWQEVIGQPMLPDKVLESIGVGPVHVEKSLETFTKSFRDIFVGNISDQMTLDMLQDFLGGMLLKLGLAIDVTSNPIIGYRYTKGAKFAFMELRSMEEATNMLNLNNVPFMGTALKISRPSRLDSTSNNAITDSNMPSFYAWDDLLTLWITGELKLLMSGHLSRAIRIGGIVSDSMLLSRDTTEYDDMMEDTREECEQFGIVTSLVALRPDNLLRPLLKQFLEEEEGRQLQSIDAKFGSVFVIMETKEEARDLLVALKGRTFDGQLVDVSFVPTEEASGNSITSVDDCNKKIADIKTKSTATITKPILHCLPRPVLTTQGVVPQQHILMLLKPLMNRQQINALVSCGYGIGD